MESFRGGSDAMDSSDTAAPDCPSQSLSSKIRPRLLWKGLPSARLPPWRVTKTPLQMALFPLAAIGYLAFCFTVHDKTVPVDTYGLYSVTPQNLDTIKGGITSISIIVISIALYPVFNIISNLKSEEFFRTLASHSHGLRLESINRISIPSFGNIDATVAMWHHACSKYYILGIVASLLVWVVATLAPGSLTLDSVLADGELMAFAVGAVPAQSVLNGMSPTEPAFNASLNSATAASVAWAEMELGVQYSFGTANPSEPDYAAFIVPTPLDLSTTTSARWLSDVVGINPTCSWASTNITTPVEVPFNLSTAAIDTYIATAYLADFNLDIQVSSTLIPTVSAYFVTMPTSAVIPDGGVANHTTHAIPTDGSTVLFLGQCLSGCGTSFVTVNLTLDLTSLDTTFTIAGTDQTWSLAILVCVPNITIETREVRNDGYAVLNVQPLSAGSTLTRQGNLNPVQTIALFTVATTSLSQITATTSSTQNQYFELGSQVLANALFGEVQMAGLPGLNVPYGTLATASPLPIENITQGYSRIIQSAAKSYLAGYLGTAYVPGRISSDEIVFAASIPNLAASTAVFGLLAMFIVVAQFRRGKDIEFTLINVAAAMHGSELPALISSTGLPTTTDADRREDADAEGDTAGPGDALIPSQAGDDVRDEHPDLTNLAERLVFVKKRADGSSILHIS